LVFRERSSSCYDDVLSRMRKVILRAHHGRLTRFRSDVNRNAFLLGCGACADNMPEEHLIIGYGVRHGSTTKVEILHHVIGGARSVRLPDNVGFYI
jgi:hypothetical protein